MLIPPKVLEVHKLTDSDSSRYALGGVKFERCPIYGTPTAVATDGRRLVVVKWKEDDADEYPSPPTVSLEKIDADNKRWDEMIVPASACKEAQTRLAPKRSVRGILTNVVMDESTPGNTVKLHGTDLDTGRTLEPRLVEGKYPRWQDVIPETDETNSSRITLDPKYLAEVALVAAKIASSDESRGIELIVPNDPTKPVVIEAFGDGEDGIHVKGVIMPMASDNDYRCPAAAVSDKDETVAQRSDRLNRPEWISEIEKRAEPVEENDEEHSYVVHTKLVSDEPENVRPCDVQRLVDSVPEGVDIKRFLNWLAPKSKPGTAETIADALAELQTTAA